MVFTLKDALDIVLRLGDRITTFWSFLATVQLTIIVVVASLHDLSLNDKIVASMTFVAFMIFHWVGLSHQYKLLNAVMDELQQQLPQAGLKSESFKEVLGKADYRNRRRIMLLIYTISSGMILYLIWNKTLRVRN